MGTLLLKLAGPLQSWGSESRFTERLTCHEPTKSGVIGLLAAALGRKREDSIDDLACLHFGVRIDQPGRYERDFQTARRRVFDKTTQTWTAGKSLPLSNRYYLADAVFVAALEGTDNQIAEYAWALDHPAFPLFLGRRSCPATGKILLACYEGLNLIQALKEQSWEASDTRLIKKHRHDKSIRCQVVRDATASDRGLAIETQRDVPISFSQVERRYGWRSVVRETINIPNKGFEPLELPEHDPMAALKEMG